MSQRWTCVAAAGATAVSLCACGSSHFANQTRPPVPVNLSVAITDARVSVSPASVGAGPVTFTIANLGASSETVTVAAAGSGGQTVLSTSRISPQGTDVVSADLSSPGDYLVSTAASATEASVTPPSAPTPAHITVGAPRPSSNNALLTP